MNEIYQLEHGNDFTEMVIQAAKEIYNSNGRNLEIFLKRYGLVSGEMKKLQDVGDEYKLSGESIKQVNDKFFERVFRKARVQSQNRVGSCYELVYFLKRRTIQMMSLILQKLSLS